MFEFDIDIEAKSLKLAEQIKKLQMEKAKLDETLETEKQRIDLAKKVGMVVVTEYKGKPFEYAAFESLLESKLVDDFDREFFGLKPLSADDPRRPKKRGRRKREQATE